MASLKSKLYEQVKRYRSMSINDVEFICKANNYKISNGERRMREICEGDEIQPIYKNPITKDVITGYKVKQPNEQGVLL